MVTEDPGPEGYGWDKDGGKGDGKQEKREKVEKERDADGPTFCVFSCDYLVQG